MRAPQIPSVFASGPVFAAVCTTVPFTTNVASCRVLEKVGYEREGLLRRSAIKDGKILDQYLYARVR